jgi:hypothetical protein
VRNGAFVNIANPNNIPENRIKNSEALGFKEFKEFRYTTIKIALNRSGNDSDSR